MGFCFYLDATELFFHKYLRNVQLILCTFLDLYNAATCLRGGLVTIVFMIPRAPERIRPGGGGIADPADLAKRSSGGVSSVKIGSALWRSQGISFLLLSPGLMSDGPARLRIGRSVAGVGGLWLTGNVSPLLVPNARQEKPL